MTVGSAQLATKNSRQFLLTMPVEMNSLWKDILPIYIGR